MPGINKDTQTSGLPGLQRFFPTLGSAIGFTAICLLALTVIYVGIHWTRIFSPAPDCVTNAVSCDEDVKDQEAPADLGRAVGLCDCRCITKYIAWGCTVRHSPVGFFRFETDDETLLRYFPPARVAEFKAALDSLITSSRESALEARRAAIDSAANLVVRSQRDDLPHPLYLYDRNQNSRAAGQLPPASYETTDLAVLTAWLEERKVEDGPSRNSTYDAVISQLKNTQLAEIEESRKILALPLELEDALSFRWLYVEQGSWIFELIFLSWLGVLVQTLAALIYLAQVENTAIKNSQERYDAAEFTLIFPRLATAPIVAIVVLAMIVAGVTGVELTLSNMPVFLFFAFLLGFANDRLIGVIRNAVKYFIPRMSINPDKIERNYGEEARKQARRVLSSFVPVRIEPTTIQSLREVAADRVSAEIAKGIGAE